MSKRPVDREFKSHQPHIFYPVISQVFTILRDLP